MSQPRRPQIIVYLGRKPSAASAELSAIIELGFTTIVTSKPDELETILKTSRSDVLILICSTQTDTYLNSSLQKSRNFSLARPLKTVALTQTINSDQIEQILRLGAQWIFSDSKNTERWIPTLRDLLRLEKHLPNLLGLQKTRAEKIEVHGIGRIGKVHFNPALGLSVESSLNLKPGDLVTLVGGLPASLPEIKANYSVASVHHDNLYYRYENRLELKPLFEITKPQLDGWIKKNNTEWAAPKTKILWVTPYYSLPKELGFDKSLFSVYVEFPQTFSSKILARISPRIVIVDETSDEVERTIETWASDQLILKNGSTGPSKWKTVECFKGETISAELTLILREYLKSRIMKASQESKFITRNSSLSQMTFQLDCNLTEISPTHFSFVSSVDFAVSAVLFFRFCSDKLRTENNSHGRVVLSEFIEDHKHFRIFCEWLPNSTALEDIIPAYKDLLG